MSEAAPSSGLERIAALCAELRHHNRDYRVEATVDHLMLLYNGQPKATADERTVIAFLENELAKFLGKTNLDDDVFYGPPAGSNRHF